MEAARHMLETTDLRIQEVAGRCGYTDQHYFSYCFKKYSGESPQCAAPPPARRCGGAAVSRPARGAGCASPASWSRWWWAWWRSSCFCALRCFWTATAAPLWQNARTSSAQAVSQVSNTVENYLSDMSEAIAHCPADAGPDRGAARRDAQRLFELPARCGRRDQLRRRRGSCWTAGPWGGTPRS